MNFRKSAIDDAKRFGYAETADIGWRVRTLQLMRKPARRMERGFAANSWCRAICITAGASMVAACVATGPTLQKDSTPEQKQAVAAQRAEARWQTLIKGDVEAAYAYLSAGSKASTSLSLYKGKIKPGRWRQAKVEKVTCEGEICSVTIQITFDVDRMKGIQTQLAESWIIENGTAWYVYR